ncbi:cell division protein DamX [Jejubacter calystegiae]|uniref:Cell division protein DamX n=1 Tax=Jejubacter calystegiae TaxID=2579935 RepID=A0A4P8YG73_9ENTR|nr:cell division protein DamX [Jejubacter calystegiae]QCT18796.1 cell division protein DamX [Jejubacter calystegiae]
MDEFKPEDELKPDPSDRRSGRQRNGASHERDNEPSINVDDVDIDEDDVRPGRRREETADDEPQRETVRPAADDDDERRPRRRKATPARKPASRQHIMMGVGILVLLLVIIGIGSALKGPSSDDNRTADSGGEKNIDLSANGADNGNPQPDNNAMAPQGSDAQNNGNPQDISLPPVSQTPTQSQPQVAQQGQQRVEVQGDLNTALTGDRGQQNQQQMDVVASPGSSTLPTQPATVAPVGNGHRSTASSAPHQTASQQPSHRSEPRQERKKTVSEQPPRTSTQQHASAPKSTASTAKATREPVKAKSETTQPAQKVATTASSKPEPTQKAATTSSTQQTAPTVAATSKVLSGNGGALQSAPSGHYTLQLSSSSNYNNLSAWAKKENLQDYVVYQTVRNGKPWYVLVKGVYASKDAAKSAVASLPSGVQARNPWTKPVAQVQSDLKQ